MLWFSAGRDRSPAALLHLLAGLMLGVLCGAPVAGLAQNPAPPAATETAYDAGGLSSDEELETLVGPVALYPDELVAIVLPAATFPVQIVQASRFIERHAKDNSLKPDEGWDASVLALINYPEVIDMMNTDLGWTTSLGEAVVNQQEDVMDAIQRFRQRTYEAGNLDTSEKVTVVREEEIIRIESVSPEVIHVPVYDPAVIVVRHPMPYVYRYSRPYPYYYSPAAVFWTGMFVGAAIGYAIHWGYRGRHRSSTNINRNININVNRRLGVRPPNAGMPWRPGPGARPGRPAQRPVERPGSRPGVGTGQRPSAGQLPATGSRQRPTAGQLPATGTRQRPTAGQLPATGTRQRPTAGQLPATGTRQRPVQQPSIRTRDTGRNPGAFAGYPDGRSAHRQQRRGSASRSGASRSGGARRR